MPQSRIRVHKCLFTWEYADIFLGEAWNDPSSGKRVHRHDTPDTCYIRPSSGVVSIDVDPNPKFMGAWTRPWDLRSTEMCPRRDQFRVLDRQEQTLLGEFIPLVTVLWTLHEVTMLPRGYECQVRAVTLDVTQSWCGINFKDEIYVNWEECNTLHR